MNKTDLVNAVAASAELTKKDAAAAKKRAERLGYFIEAVLREQKIELECVYEYKDASKIQIIRKYGELLEEEYREDGIFVRAFVPVDVYEKVRVPRTDSPNSDL